MSVTLGDGTLGPAMGHTMPMRRNLPVRRRARLRQQRKPMMGPSGRTVGVGAGPHAGRRQRQRNPPAASAGGGQMSATLPPIGSTRDAASPFGVFNRTGPPVSGLRSRRRDGEHGTRAASRPVHGMALSGFGLNTNAGPLIVSRKPRPKQQPRSQPVSPPLSQNEEQEQEQEQEPRRAHQLRILRRAAPAPSAEASAPRADGGAEPKGSWQQRAGGGEQTAHKVEASTHNRTPVWSGLELNASATAKAAKQSTHRPKDRTQTRLMLTATAKSATTSLQVELMKGECSAGSTSAEVCADKDVSSSFSSVSGPISGVLRVGVCAVEFHVGETKKRELLGGKLEDDERNFIKNQLDGIERSKVTLVDCATGDATDVSLSEGWTATLTLTCRKATAVELQRQDGTEALLRAEKGSKYSALLAQLIRARANHVEYALIDRAEKKLKQLKVVAPSSDLMKKVLKWSKVTTGDGEAIETSCELEGCAVGAEREGEVCMIEERTMNEALENCDLAPKDGTRLDKWMFQRMAEAMLLGEKDGAVWRSGKHVIFSNPNRNQAPTSLRNYLLRLGLEPAASALDALIAYTENKFFVHVSAVQVTLHLDGSTCHKQHHDIYSIAQRAGAGRDCTCSFNENIATCCYTLGSSRRCMLRAAPCKVRHKCCEACTGYSKKPWLHSGCSMFFNKAWNRTWTHGIPHHDRADGDLGPRMSMSLLCAAGNFSVPFLTGAGTCTIKKIPEVK